MNEALAFVGKRADARGLLLSGDYQKTFLQDQSVSFVFSTAGWSALHARIPMAFAVPRTQRLHYLHPDDGFCVQTDWGAAEAAAQRHVLGDAHGFNYLLWSGGAPAAEPFGRDVLGLPLGLPAGGEPTGAQGWQPVAEFGSVRVFWRHASGVTASVVGGDAAGGGSVPPAPAPPFFHAVARAGAGFRGWGCADRNWRTAARADYGVAKRGGEDETEAVGFLPTAALTLPASAVKQGASATVTLQLQPGMHVLRAATAACRRAVQPKPYYLQSACLHALLKGVVDQTLEAQALRAARGPFAARLHAGDALRAAGRAPEAMAQYEAIARLQPARSEPWRALGAMAQEARRPAAEVLEQFERAVAADPTNAEARSDTGVVLQGLGPGRQDEAGAHYLAATALDPGFAAAFLYLGGIQQAQGKQAEAAINFGKAVEIDPALMAHFKK